MFSLSFVILTSILTALICSFIGWHAKNILGKPTSKEKKLSSVLQDTQKELHGYKQKINNHFEHTADLFNDLSKQYKNLYHHLKTSSMNLCNTDYSISLLEQQKDKVDSWQKIKPFSKENNSIKENHPEYPDHNWHPTYFEARDAKESSSEKKIESSPKFTVIKNNKEEALVSKNAPSSDKQSSEQPIKHSVGNLLEEKSENITDDSLKNTSKQESSVELV